MAVLDGDNMKRIMVISFVIMCLMVSNIPNGSASVSFDYSDLADHDFSMGNYYNDNVSFNSVPFDPSMEFIDEARSGSDVINQMNCYRMFRIGEEWSSFQFDLTGDNELNIWTSRDFFAYNDDSDSAVRARPIWDNLSYSAIDNLDPISFWNGSAWFVYLRDSVTEDITGHRFENGTHYEQIVHDGLGDEDRFGEIYRYNETHYFAWLFNETGSEYPEINLMLSEDLMNWTHTGIERNSETTNFTSIYDYAYYEWNGTKYGYVRAYNESTAEIEHAFFTYENVGDLQNYTFLYSFVDDSIEYLRYYPIGTHLVRRYLNANLNSITVGTHRYDYRIQDRDNLIYKFYWNGVYEYVGELNESEDAVNVNDYFGIVMTTSQQDASLYWTTDYYTEYGINNWIFKNLAYVNITGFDLDDPIPIEFDTYLPLDDDLGKKNPSGFFYINTTQPDLSFFNPYWAEIESFNDVDYTADRSWGIGIRGVSEIKSINFFSISTGDDERDSFTIKIFNDPEDAESPFWFTVSQLEISDYQNIIGGVAIMVGAIMIAVNRLPTKTGATLVAVGVFVLLGLGFFGAVI